MTEQIDPQFELFSEMLDNEEALTESTVSALGKDGALLLDLRRHLRADATISGLPEGFASATARAVQERIEGQSPALRALVYAEPMLRSAPFSKLGLPWAFSGTLLLLGAATVSWKAVVLLGSVALVFGVGANLLLRRYLPLHIELPEVWRDEATSHLSRLFYLLPVLSVLATSVAGGLALAKLGEVSLSFQSNSTNLKLAGAAGTLIVAAWLTNALWPIWRAYEEATRGRNLRGLFVQGLHATWLWLMLFALLDVMELASGPPVLMGMGVPETLLAICALLALGMTWTVSGRRPSGPRQSSLLTAFRRTFVGILIGLVPIVGSFVAFYQASLTRELSVGPQYAEMTRFAEEWKARQKAVRPEDNGMTELEPILYARNGEPKDGNAAATRLSGGAELLGWFTVLDAKERATPKAKAERDKARKEFLQELPRVEAALAKPHFTYHSNRELRFDMPVPNFITCRSIGSGLEGLTREAMENGDLEQALRYQSLNMRWATGLREGVLIDRMIGVALEKIALSSVESMIFEAKLSDDQLRKLQELLEQTAPQPSEFRDTMFLESYGLDSSLKSLAEGDVGTLNAYDGDGGTLALARLVPRSFWESERKVMLNLQLSQTANWTELTPSSSSELEDALRSLPFSLSQGMLPNLHRAQVQFMFILSRHYALQVEIALERYKLKNGQYPENLEALVPEYLKEVPVDPMHPNLWKHKGGFEYQGGGASYRLVSKSPLYDSLTLKSSTQQYGPDGDYVFEL